MKNNDVLRRLRFVFDFNDDKMISLFALGGFETTRAEVSDWLKKEEDPAYTRCGDEVLSSFLNGLIIDRRGKKDDKRPVAEKHITNNMIFTKLKIALSLQADDVLSILESAGLFMSKHELSAFFRNPEHKHYRECQDQVIRNFLKGLRIKFRPDVSDL